MSVKPVVWYFLNYEMFMNFKLMEILKNYSNT
jgi:hypothetical protein